MNDAPLVRGLERVGHLFRDRQRLVDGDRTLRDAVGERRTFDQFHHQRGRGARSLQAIDGRDVRMIQRGEDFRLTLKPRQPTDVSGNSRRQNLDRDLALQVGVRRAIHLPHPAHANLGNDFIRAEAGAGAERHQCPGIPARLYGRCVRHGSQELRVLDALGLAGIATLPARSAAFSQFRSGTPRAFRRCRIGPGRPGEGRTRRGQPR